VSFDVAADAYDRFMGRYAEPLAAEFVDRADVRAGRRAVDVGCDPGAPDESDLAGAREGHLAELFDAAGLRDIESSVLTVTVGFETFADWWDPYRLGVGPAGAYVARLDDEGREALRDRCEALLPTAPFELDASAWCVHARV
jgi:hypothetical protein